MTDHLDHVGRIQQQWRRERPDLDVTPQGLFGRLHRLADRLREELDVEFRRHGLGEGEFDVLAALRRSGVPYRLSPGQLVAQTMVTSGTMTNRIDRLTGRGLVRRLPDPADGRGVMVQLEDSGRRLADAALADLLEIERTVLSVIDAGEQDRLSGLLRELLTSLELPVSP